MHDASAFQLPCWGKAASHYLQGRKIWIFDIAIHYHQAWYRKLLGSLVFVNSVYSNKEGIARASSEILKMIVPKDRLNAKG